MSNDYGKKISKAFEAIYQLHLDASKLLQDCDGTIGKGRQSIFGNIVTRDLSRAIYEPGTWMPAGLYRFYDASAEILGLVEGLAIYYWEHPPLHDEPLLILGQIKYRVEERSTIRSVCKEWDLWYAYFEWCENPRVNDVIAFKRDVDEEGRTEWFKLCALSLYSIKSMEDVEQLMARVRQAQV
jgi:hypothetical protein